jgi:hypothetical protein
MVVIVYGGCGEVFAGGKVGSGVDAEGMLVVIFARMGSE